MRRDIYKHVVIAFLLCGLMYAQNPADTATTTLRKYVQLRMNWADWNDYSPFISWPDEPGWDCWWVARGYEMGTATRRGKKTLIPVTFHRIGRFCADFSLEHAPKTQKINFELVPQQGAWKVSGPQVDYPTISTSALRKYLSSEASRNTNPPERRKQAQQALKELSSYER